MTGLPAGKYNTHQIEAMGEPAQPALHARPGIDLAAGPALGGPAGGAVLTGGAALSMGLHAGGARRDRRWPEVLRAVSIKAQAGPEQTGSPPASQAGRDGWAACGRCGC